MPIDARIPGQAVPSTGQNPLANLGQLLQLSGGIQAQQREGQTRDLLSDPASYGDSTEGIAGPSVPQGGMTAADLRPDALRSLRGLNPELALGMEQFAQRQQQEARAMSTWEREAKAKEAGSQAKFWGQMADAGMKVWDDYQAALGGANPNDPTASFKARAAAQMSYEFQKQGLSDIAKTMGFELPEFFNLDDFKPEHFAQFRQAQHAEEQKLYLLQVPAEDPGGAPQTVVVAGSPAQVAAEAKRTGATAVGEVPKGLPEVTDASLKGMSPEKLAQLAEQQGDNYVGASKDYLAVRDSFGRINASADGTAAGDLALIFNYMKMLDPGSTVREGEFASAAASGSYGERFQAAAQNIIAGTRLSEEQRKDFLGQSRKLMRTMQDTQKRSRDNYRKIAKRSGLNEDDITDRVVMLELKAEEAARVPPPSGAQAGGGAVQALPQAVRDVPGLQRSKVSGNYRNPATGEEWDAQGNPIARPGG